MLVMLIIAGLFGWSAYGHTSWLMQPISVPFTPGVLAILAFIIIAISYFTTPPHALKQSATINYVLLMTTLVVLLVTTQGTSSAFLSIFILALAFGASLGIFGVTTSVASAAAFICQQYFSDVVDISQILALSILCGIAIISGLILWGRSETSADNTREDRAYNELANELSAVAGKSEVVINAIGEGVLALDGQGIIQLINPAAQQLLGWGKHDAVSLNYKSVLKLLDTKNQEVDETNNPVAQALSNNKSVKNDNFSLQTRSGKNFLASISVNPVGQLGSGIIVVFRDITTEKSDERQRAEFISTASHEMRTPVASIEGYLGLALNPATATIDEKARDFITKAHESARHLGRLFADLLDVSKADDSRLKNDPKVVDIVPFIHDIVEGLTPQAVEKGLRVIYKPMPDGRQAEDSARRINPVFYANVDNDHLREIVQNLVENAIKYTLQGNVVVDVTGDNERVTISVTDSGIGIPKEDQAHLFQKFYRVDNSDTREIGGTGLGLYLCRRLTETIGGRIWVESEYKRGSTFFVELPRIDHDDAQRLIELASVEAERQAEIEQAKAGRSALNPTQAHANESPSPLPVEQSSQPAPQPSMAQRIPIPQAPLPETAQPPLTPQQVMPQPPAPQYAPAPQPTQPANIPLSAIEANPRQYLADRQSNGLTVPPRQQ